VLQVVVIARVSIETVGPGPGMQVRDGARLPVFSPPSQVFPSSCFSPWGGGWGREVNPRQMSHLGCSKHGPCPGTAWRAPISSPIPWLRPFPPGWQQGDGVTPRTGCPQGHLWCWRGDRQDTLPRHTEVPLCTPLPQTGVTHGQRRSRARPSPPCHPAPAPAPFPNERGENRA